MYVVTGWMNAADTSQISSSLPLANINPIDEVKHRICSHTHIYTELKPIIW